MNLLFPNRDRLTRDPLGFFLDKADSALGPLEPLALGFHRVFLVTDLAFITDGRFSPGTLRVPASPSALFAPIEISQAGVRPRIVQPKTATNAEDCTTIMNGITHELLIGLRKDIFSAYRHASFDCWRFSSLLATRLTFIALFGSSSEEIIDQQGFSHHAEVVHSFKDPIAVDYICKRQRQKKEKERSCEQSSLIIQSAALKAFAYRQALSVCGYTHKKMPSSAEVCQLVLAVQQTTAAAVFWALFALARSRSLRKIVEEEADACLSSDGDIANDKLHSARTTRDISLEILRLVPSNNIIVFDFDYHSVLADQEFRDGDKLVVCPHIVFRSNRHFANANKLMTGRKYEEYFFKLQHLSCSGGVVFQLVLLNLTLLLLDLAAAFELELVEGPGEFNAFSSSRTARPDIKIRLNLRRSRLFR